MLMISGIFNQNLGVGRSSDKGGDNGISETSWKGKEKRTGERESKKVSKALIIWDKITKGGGGEVNNARRHCGEIQIISFMVNLIEPYIWYSDHHWNRKG